MRVPNDPCSPLSCGQVLPDEEERRVVFTVW